MKYNDPEYLEKSDEFQLVHELRYDHIISFVFDNIRKKTFSAWFYFFINILNLVLIIYFLIHGLQNGTLEWKHFGLQFLAGLFAGSILVIPFHEGFHGLAYKILGAPKIHFGADMKQLIFYVAAHNYVLNRKGFYILAYTPFIMINIIAISLFFLFPGMGVHSLLFFLFFHNLMCIGDLAMVSFYESHPEANLYTYDDVPNRISYIYERLKQEDILPVK
jgi:hypothetical protein